MTRNSRKQQNDTSPLSTLGYRAQDRSGRLIVALDAIKTAHELSSSIQRDSTARFSSRAAIEVVLRALDYIRRRFSLVFIDHKRDSSEPPIELAQAIQTLRTKGYGFRDFRVLVHYHDMPKFFMRRIFCDEVSGTGKSLTSEAAAMYAAVGEAIERRVFGLPRSIWKTRQHRSRLFGRVFPEELLRLYYLAQRKHSSSSKQFHVPSDAIRVWARGEDVLEQRSCWLPAQIVFWGGRVESPFMENFTITARTSSGCSCAPTKDEALVSGLLELIERDAFMISWMRKIPPRNMPVASLLQSKHLDGYLRSLIEDTIRYRFDLNITWLPTDFPVHVCCVVLRDPTFLGPSVTIGARADFDPQKAIQHALLEALTTYIALRLRIDSGKAERGHQAKKAPINHWERLDWWGRADAYHDIDWFIHGKTSPLTSLSQPERVLDAQDKLSLLIQAIRAKQYHLYIYTAPDRAVQELGFWPVRTIVPELVPLHLGNDAPLNHPRLQQPPPEFGLNNPDQWNSVFHPFP